MWEYLTRGYFDIVGSDHAPYTKEEKEKGNGDIFVPPAGCPGLSTRLPLMFTAVKEGKLKLREREGDTHHHKGCECHDE